MTWHNLHLYLGTLRRAREAIAAGRALADVQQIAREGRALVQFGDYARHLLHKQIISASEVLLSLAD